MFVRRLLWGWTGGGSICSTSFAGSAPAFTVSLAHAVQSNSDLWIDAFLVGRVSRIRLHPRPQEVLVASSDNIKPQKNRFVVLVGYGDRPGYQAYKTMPTSCRRSSMRKMPKLHCIVLGTVLTVLAQEHTDYIGVKVEGPFKVGHYRY